jgi:hypothetical protein
MEPIEPFIQWYDECVREDAATRVRSSVLYESYSAWAGSRSATDILDIKAFGAKLAAKGFEEPKKSNGYMLWRGICMRN